MCYNKGTVKGTATTNPTGQGHNDRLNNSQSRTEGLTATPIILLKEVCLWHTDSYGLRLDRLM